jgi:hypothetical protein
MFLSNNISERELGTPPINFGDQFHQPGGDLLLADLNSWGYQLVAHADDLLQ